MNANVDNGSCAYDSYADTALLAYDSLVWNGITYFESGVYTFVTVNAAGCDSIFTLNLVIDVSLSVDYIDLNSIHVFPNPASEYINIDFGNLPNTQLYTAVITNASGSVVYTEMIQRKNTMINTTSWGAAGLYFIHFYDTKGNTIATKQIILE